jgi:hypothetical protein
MDENKVTPINNGPKPTIVKELQLFIGFSNYYRRFIQNFSSTAAPLTALTSQKTLTLQWTETALTAFNILKHLFTSAPVLRQPDPTLPFTLEVEASGVGAILSQRVGTPPKSHPCAFFSRKLFPA